MRKGLGRQASKQTHPLPLTCGSSLSSREISCVIWSSDSTRSSCGGSCGCPLFSKPAWAGWGCGGGGQRGVCRTLRGDGAASLNGSGSLQRPAAAAPRSVLSVGGGAHLANRKQALDDVLAALVDGALVQDRAEALKHGVQAAGGDILRSGQWEGGRSARWAGRGEPALRSCRRGPAHNQV